MKNKLYEVKEYRDMREFINHSVAKFPNNVAFTIKTKAGKEPEYKDITYKEFKKDIDNFGAGLIKLGLSGKRIAVIGKNSYEWALTYYTVLSSVEFILTVFTLIKIFLGSSAVFKKASAFSSP